MKNKKIGILGSGVVGKALAAGFIKYENQVMIGTSHPSKLDDWKATIGKSVYVGSFSDTAKFGDIIVLAVKGSAAIDVLTKAGGDNLSGKTIIDATNPIADAPPVNGVIKFFTSLDNSLMEELQAKLQKANFVKAFNSVGHSLMVNPDFKGITPTMFICGNNDNAKKEATEIIEQFGYEAEDMGKVEAARAIEPLCILWCIPGFNQNRWMHAFKLLKM